MWNEVLNRLDRVKTPQRAIESWGGLAGSCVLVNHGINSVYRFLSQGQHYYLRIAHGQLRHEAELLASMAFQRYLWVHQVPVCEPIPARSGAWVVALDQGEDIFLAHVCKAVPGSALQFDHQDSQVYINWGKALGAFHRVATQYAPGIHHYTDWHQSLDELQGYAHLESTVIQEELTQVTAHFFQCPQTPHLYGLNHGDHREANVLSEKRQIHFIDFDLPCYHWFMSDFSRPFFQSIVQGDVRWTQHFHAYLSGYQSVMPLSQEVLHEFSWHIRMKLLEIYLWTKNNFEPSASLPGAETSVGQCSMAQLQKAIVDQTWMLAVDQVIFRKSMCKDFPFFYQDECLKSI